MITCEANNQCANNQYYKVSAHARANAHPYFLKNNVKGPPPILSLLWLMDTYHFLAIFNKI